jgi:hypothetical protein
MVASETIQYNRLFLREKHSSLFFPTGSDEVFITLMRASETVILKNINSNGQTL